MVVSTAVMHLVQGGCLQVTERLKLQLQAHLLSESSAEIKNPSLSQLRMNFIVKKILLFLSSEELVYALRHRSKCEERREAVSFLFMKRFSKFCTLYSCTYIYIFNIYMYNMV